MSSRTRLEYDIKLNSTGETLRIELSDPGNLQADNLALATWGAAEILANALHRFPPNLANTGGLTNCTPVVELGAGTGLAGLSAAAIWRTPIFLTDLPSILPGIEKNIALNRAALAEYSALATAGSLDWARPKLLELHVQEDHVMRIPNLKARVILAADTVYSEEHPALLVGAISAILQKHPDSRVYFCYPLRVGYLDHIRDLWETLEQAGLVCIYEEKEMLDQAWDEDTPYEVAVFRWQSTVVSQ